MTQIERGDIVNKYKSINYYKKNEENKKNKVLMENSYIRFKVKQKTKE